jgi:hypothetical protein
MTYLISFFVIDLFILIIGVSIGFWWASRGCQEEIEVAYGEGYKAGYFASK